MTRALDENERLLLQAAAKVDVTMIRILAWRVKNFNVRDKNGNTPLHLVCARSLNAEEAVNLLVVRRDVSVNAQNNAGETPLHTTALRGDTRAVAALLGAHANPFVVDNSGQSPAHRYLTSGFHQGLEVLLDRSYRKRLLMDQPDGSGNTLVHLAALHAPNLVADLLSRGANMGIRNKEGFLPEDLCTDEFAKRLLQAARKSNLVSDALDSKQASSDDLKVGTPPGAAGTASDEDAANEALAVSAQKALEFLAASRPPKLGLSS